MSDVSELLEYLVKQMKLQRFSDVHFYQVSIDSNILHSTFLTSPFHPSFTMNELTIGIYEVKLDFFDIIQEKTQNEIFKLKIYIVYKHEIIIRCMQSQHTKKNRNFLHIFLFTQHHVAFYLFTSSFIFVYDECEFRTRQYEISLILVVHLVCCTAMKDTS